MNPSWIMLPAPALSALVNLLDEELLLYIFTFLEARDVLRCDECCRSWSRIIRDQGADARLWRPLWASVIDSSHRMDFVKNVPTASTASRVRMLPAAALRRALKDNHVDTSRCVEISDYRAMVLASIVFISLPPRPYI